MNHLQNEHTASTSQTTLKLFPDLLLQFNAIITISAAIITISAAITTTICYMVLKALHFLLYVESHTPAIFTDYRRICSYAVH